MFDVLTHQRYLRALEWIQHDVLSQVRSIAPTMEELASGLYHHGAVYLRSDMYERLEADESVQLLSVPSSKGQLLFLVSCSLYNLCDPGCFCAGQKAFTVQCYTPAPTTVTKATTAPGAECLLGYAWPTGEAVSFPSEKNYAVWAPDANSIEDQFVGLQGNLGALLRMVVLGANNCGLGRRFWGIVDVNHHRYRSRDRYRLSGRGFENVGLGCNALGKEVNESLFKPAPVEPLPSYFMDHLMQQQEDEEEDSEEGDEEAPAPPAPSKVKRDAEVDWPALRSKDDEPSDEIAVSGVGASPRYIMSELLHHLARNVSQAEAGSLTKLCAGLRGWQKTVRKAAAKHNCWSDDEDEDDEDDE